MRPRTRAKLTFVSFIALAAAMPLSANSQVSDVAHLHELQKIKDDSFKGSISERDRIQLILRSYQRLFPSTGESLREVSTDDLQASFQASYIAAFFGLRPKDIREMEALLEELDSRKATTKSDYVDMQGIYISSRMFDEASALRGRHPELDLPPVPLLEHVSAGERRPGRLIIQNGGATLTYSEMDTRSKQIVIVAHPLCHFSANLVKDIQHTELAQVFSHATWLVPPDTDLYIKDMQSWNARYPSDGLSFVYRKEDWPMFDAWATPTFYFMNGGRVVARVQGWPPQGGAQALTEAIAKWKASKP